MIEDAAEMIGQTYKNKLCGSFGDISTVSFYPNKHITTGEGGMILTDDDSLAEKCRELRNLCFQKNRRFVHERLGWNLRMTNLQAALGVAQLEQIERFVEKKRWIGNMYNELFVNLKGIQKPLPTTNYARNIYWVYGLVLKNDLKFNASDAIKNLAKYGVNCRPFFYPLHKQPILKKMGFFKNETYPVAEKISNYGFYLPSGLALKHEQIKYIADSLIKITK